METNNETNNINEQERLKIPTGKRQISWLLTKRDRGSELGTTEKQIQLVVKTELEPRTSDL